MPVSLPNPTVFGEERRLTIYGKSLAYLEAHAAAKPTVVMVHGWLDNAASFADIVARLDARCLAVDMYGHGLSDHAPLSQRYYNVIDSVYDLIEFLAALDLRDVCLVGHSLGASVCSLATAIAPERIGRLILLDGMIPFPDTENELVKRSRRLLGEIAKSGSDVSARRLASFEDAVAKRLAASRMPRHTAETICARSVGFDGENWHWRWDPRQMRTSPLRLSPAQLTAYLAAITRPSTLVRAVGEGALEMLRAALPEYAPALPGLRMIDVATGHYVHAEMPDLCAKLISDGFNQTAGH